MAILDSEVIKKIKASSAADSVVTGRIIALGDTARGNVDFTARTTVVAISFAAFHFEQNCDNSFPLLSLLLIRDLMRIPRHGGSVAV